MDYCVVFSCLLYLHSEPSPNRQIERVTEIAKLVTQILKHDWSLDVYLRPITSQYFNIIQTYLSPFNSVADHFYMYLLSVPYSFSPLPNPPVDLLAICLECIAVVTVNKPTEVRYMYVFYR